MEFTVREIEAFSQMASALYGRTVMAFAEPISSKLRLVMPDGRQVTGGLEVGNIFATAEGYNIVLSHQPASLQDLPTQQEVVEEAFTPTPPEAYEMPAEAEAAPMQETAEVTDAEKEALLEESKAFERELNSVVGEDKPPIVGGETPDIVPIADPKEVPQQGAEPQVGYGPRRIG